MQHVSAFFETLPDDVGYMVTTDVLRISVNYMSATDVLRSVRNCIICTKVVALT